MLVFHSGMLHGYEGQSGTTHVRMNLAVLILCIRTLCYAECGVYQAFQTNLITSGQELGFDRSHNGGWRENSSNPNAMLFQCKNLNFSKNGPEFLPGIIEKKCRWSLHKCLWHCKATSNCYAFEFGTGNSGGDAYCRFYNQINNADRIGTRVNDPTIIFESFIRCKKGYTQVRTKNEPGCVDGIKLTNRFGGVMEFQEMTFEECRAACAKENKDGVDYGCKSFDFSNGFTPEQGPDHCDAGDLRLFEGLKCSFKRTLKENQTCSAFCESGISGTKLKCVRSWLEENVADFGKNNCDKRYLQEEDVVCVCANVGTCTLYATRPNCTEKASTDMESTRFLMDRPTVIPKNLRANVTVRDLDQLITNDNELKNFSHYSTKTLTCDDGGLVNLYNGGKLNLYDCARACKQTPGCFVFKYEEREIKGVLYPTVCQWQKTLEWNKCVHTRRLSDYSQSQNRQNLIFSGLYQVAEEPTTEPKCAPGQYYDLSDSSCHSQTCIVESIELSRARLQKIAGDGNPCGDTLKAHGEETSCSLECVKGSYNQKKIQTLYCRPGPSDQKSGHLNTALISCREQTCVVKSSDLKNMHTTVAPESCVEVSSYEAGYLVKKITLIAAREDANSGEGRSECKMKCDSGYYYASGTGDPILTCSANADKKISSGSPNSGQLRCEAKLCILKKEDWEKYKKSNHVVFEDCYGAGFETLRSNHMDEITSEEDIILQAVGDYTSCALKCEPEVGGERYMLNKSADTELRCSPLSNSRDRGTLNEEGIAFVCVKQDENSLIPEPWSLLDVLNIKDPDSLDLDMSYMMMVILIVVTILVPVTAVVIAFSMDRISFRRVKKHVKKN